MEEMEGLTDKEKSTLIKVVNRLAIAKSDQHVIAEFMFNFQTMTPIIDAAEKLIIVLSKYTDENILELRSQVLRNNPLAVHNLIACLDRWIPAHAIRKIIDDYEIKKKCEIKR
jgi:ABC-type arginine transport system ATPase subunit